ncbi:MAG: cyclase family protein [Gemmataceae bacterium]|nr:cyclase family protein [Gemmata sp.]MDW8199397.1 cyclase family protein [Gemmataceae bacterium]
MCAPSVLHVALAGMNRREALHFAVGVMAGALASTGEKTAAARPTEETPPDPRPIPRPPQRAIAADTILDLTHTLTPTFPIWPGNKPIALTNTSTFAQHGFYANRWDVGEHHGTHLDAPAHCSADGATVEAIEPASFIAPLAVIDLRERVKNNPDAAVTVDDLTTWEKRHGRLPKGCAVALYSGWDQHAGDAKAFLGTDATGTLHFPGFSQDAAAFLRDERDVVGLLVDTLSIDIGATQEFPVHKLWLGAGKWCVECVAHLGRVPPSGATVFVGTPKVKSASGGPTRVLALWS